MSNSILSIPMQIKIQPIPEKANPCKYNQTQNELLHSYSNLLKKYIRSHDLTAGRRLHHHVRQSNLPFDHVLHNSLITLYSKCNQLNLAYNVFDEMGQRKNIVSWTTMMSAYTHNKSPKESIFLFLEFLDLGFIPNEFTFCSVLQACIGGSYVGFGNMTLGFAMKMGFACNDLSVGCVLIDMFAKRDELVLARKVFDGMKEKNVVVWTLMITRYVQNGYYEEALDLFIEMGVNGFSPDQFTMSSVISGCIGLGSIELDMYAKCGGALLDDSRKAFDQMDEHNVMSWTSIISNYVHNGGDDEAIKLFLDMITQGRVRPNHFTYSSVLKACANSSSIELGEQVHAQVVKSGLSSINFVGNSLVSMYTRGGRMEEARKAFEVLFDKNMVAYNAIVDGYIKNVDPNEAFKLVHQVENMDIGMNAFTFASLLSAAASIGVMSKGQQLHAQLLKAGFESDTCIGNALVSMYSKCGNVDDARSVFEEMSTLNVISYTSMITGFAKHGYAHQALELFSKMTSKGVKPNEVTYIAVLSACSHVGLVEKGKKYFNSMQKDYKLLPRMEHYACMIDLLGRSGFVDEAFEFITNMPFQADALVWRTLLGACTVHKNIKLGEICAKYILELEPEDPAAYVLLSNLYAMAGKWDEVAKIRKCMKEKKVNKEAGLSWVEIENVVHKFHVGDTSHARAREIFNKLDDMVEKIKKMGYVVDKSYVLHDVEDELKEKYILQHSEKIAVAFGLISKNAPKPIRVFKNLRVCGDCHNAIKFISKATRREIIVRDSNRFHRFSDGVCSCGDYW